MIKGAVGSLILIIHLSTFGAAQIVAPFVQIEASANLIGADCVSTTSLSQYTLTDSDQQYAYRYVWWYSGWGVELILDRANPASCTLRGSINSTPGTLNVGVDYRIDENYYRQYAKNITKCSGGGHITTNLLDNTNAPETIWYFKNQNVTIQTPEQMSSISFYDANGNLLQAHFDLSDYTFQLSENHHGLVLVKVLLKSQKEVFLTVFLP
jgi:hypothetical protein